MSKSILDKLVVRERFERRILRGYEDILYSVFQTIYEVDAHVIWDRIYRFSNNSHFIMVSGKATIPIGTTLSNGKILTEPLELIPSFTMPWCMLDDNSTAYEIAEAAKDILIAAQLLGDQFVTAMRSGDFSYDVLRNGLSADGLIESTKQDCASENGIDLIPIQHSDPAEDDSLDMDELTQVQMRRMMLQDNEDG